MAGHSIAGSWRGHYSYYNVPDAGSGFEVIFIDDGGALTGSVLDDCGLGEASLSGSFSFPSVKFTKVYFARALAPIHYDGTMSEDGKTISGKWLIVESEGAMKGSWTAHRTDEEGKKEEKEKQVKVKERELDEVLLQ